MQRIFMLAAVSFVLIFGGGPLLLFGSAGKATAQETSTIEIVEMVLGAEDAPITVIEYASFTCPHCATFHEKVFGGLKANYIDTGKIRFVYRDVFFDRFGLWASMVARCDGPEKFFDISDRLYQSQKDWAAGEDPAVIAGKLRQIGLAAGIGEEKLETCLSDGAKAEALVAWFQENAKIDKISSTPTFIVAGKKEANMNYADFSGLLDQKLGEK